MKNAEKTDLFDEYQLADLKLKNKFVMAPMTRNRANADGTATDLMAKYYAQRAGAGLIISEATNISDQAYGYILTPGIYTNDHIESWKKVTKAVHDKDGKIFCQLWHCGRISHEDVQPNGQKPVAPSAIKAEAQAYTEDGNKDCSMPRALEKSEIKQIINDYKNAAKAAKDANFDGVEIHSANGYLLHQFIADNTNKRSDQYGGSVENRCRMTLEVIDAVKEVWDEQRIGIRLAPVSPFNDVKIDRPNITFEYLVSEIDKRNLGYIHIIEGSTQDDRDHGKFDYDILHESFNNTYIANNKLDLELAIKLSEKNELDLACIGRPFIANPDLVERYLHGFDIAQPDENTFYGGGAEGYTDYPRYNSKS